MDSGLPSPLDAPVPAGTLDELSRALAAAEAGRARLTLIAEASRMLAATLDAETALGNLARLVTPAIADWCIIDVLTEAGTLEQMALVHMDPVLQETARELRRRYPPLPEEPVHPIFQVIQSGRSLLEETITMDDLRARARDADHLVLLQAMDIRSHMIVPLSLRGRVLGAMSFVCGPSGRTFSADDLALAEELGHRAARALDTAQLYAAEQRARAEAEEAARRMHVTNSLIALAASALDLGDVFDEFGAILRLLIPFVHASISLAVADGAALTTPYVKGPTLQIPGEQLAGSKVGTVRGWVIDHRRSYVRTDTAETAEFVEDDLFTRAGIRAYLIVPMRVGGRVIGTLNFGHDLPGSYTDAHARAAQPVADQLALTVSRFQLFDQVQRRAGELSETLQRALLPAELPQPPFCALGALYLPADAQAGIGGDWFDALLLPDDTLLVSIGDVAGHGIPAAAAMGQVRHFVRAYAMDGRSPGEIIPRLHRYLGRLPGEPHLAIWVALLDPYSGALRSSGAGHPPLLVMRPDGALERIPCAGPPLGRLRVDYPESRRDLPAGSRIIACTDGLLEASRDIAGSEERLRHGAVRSRPAPPEAAARQLAEDVVGSRPHEDDIAILIIDLLPQDAPLSFSVPAAPESLHRVRRAVRTFAERSGVRPGRVEEVVLAVGEAALNSVEHAYPEQGGQLRVRGERRDGTVVIAVHDAGRWRDPLERGRGRGLRMMREFADAVQISTGPEGTVVELRWALG